MNEASSGSQIELHYAGGTEPDYSPECDADLILNPDQQEALLTVQISMTDGEYDAVLRQLPDDESLPLPEEAREQILSALRLREDPF